MQIFILLWFLLDHIGTKIIEIFNPGPTKVKIKWKNAKLNVPILYVNFFLEYFSWCDDSYSKKKKIKENYNQSSCFNYD